MSTVKRADDPYAAGWTAFARGEKCSSNPYTAGSDSRRLWRMGWLAAENYSEMRRERSA